MNDIKLNLGCGNRKLPGYINVDKVGIPDIKHDLELFPWPWETNTVSEIKLIHVLEHLGQDTEIYFGIFKEIYRICKHGAKIFISVPDTSFTVRMSIVKKSPENNTSLFVSINS